MGNCCCGALRLINIRKNEGVLNKISQREIEMASRLMNSKAIIAIIKNLITFCVLKVIMILLQFLFAVLGALETALCTVVGILPNPWLGIGCGILITIKWSFITIVIMGLLPECNPPFRPDPVPGGATQKNKTNQMHGFNPTPRLARSAMPRTLASRSRERLEYAEWFPRSAVRARRGKGQFQRLISYFFRND